MANLLIFRFAPRKKLDVPPLRKASISVVDRFCVEAAALGMLEDVLGLRGLGLVA